MYVPATAEEIEAIFAKRLNKEDITKEEELKFKTAFMQFVAKQYHKRDWVMQIHYGCRRDNNTPYYKRLGPDTGYDCIDNYAPSAQTAAFLDSINATEELPKTILYSLNPMITKPSERSLDVSRILPQQERSSREVHGGLTITRQE